MPATSRSCSRSHSSLAMPAPALHPACRSSLRGRRAADESRAASCGARAGSCRRTGRSSIGLGLAVTGVACSSVARPALLEPAVAARQPGDLRGHGRRGVLRPAPQPAAAVGSRRDRTDADRVAGGRGRAASATSPTRYGRRGPDRLPHVHEAGPVVSDDRPASPVRRRIGRRRSRTSAARSTRPRWTRRRGSCARAAWSSSTRDAARPISYLVNTCTVTAAADDKSRKAVRRARRASPAAEVIVTGLLRAGGPGGVRRGRPGGAARRRTRRRTPCWRRSSASSGPAAGRPTARARPARPARRAALPTLAGVEIEGIADDRARIERTRAYVKVQDGCSLLLHLLHHPPRPAARSARLPPEAVLADVRRALAAGPPRDRAHRDQHRDLRRRLVRARPPRRPRCAPPSRSPGWSGGSSTRRRSSGSASRSIEPQHVDDDLLAAWTDEGAGPLPAPPPPAAPVRRRRRAAADGPPVRRGRLRPRPSSACAHAIPGVAIHADVIAGFPTEDDAACARSLAFIRELDPAGLHVFRYSARPGHAGGPHGRPGARRAGPAGARRRAPRAVAAARRARVRGPRPRRRAPDGPVRGRRRPATRPLGRATPRTTCSSRRRRRTGAPRRT